MHAAGALCPKCRSQDVRLTGHCAGKIDERPRFTCGACRETWTAGATGAPYAGFALRRPADGTTATAEGLFLDLDADSRPDGATAAKCPNCGWKGFAMADALAHARCLRCRSRHLVAADAQPATASAEQPAPENGRPTETGSQ